MAGSLPYVFPIADFKERTQIMRILLDEHIRKILESPHQLYGEKSKPQLIVDSEGMAYKFFHPKKKLISSKTFRPPAKRFKRNAEELNTRGVQAPIIEETFRAERSKCLILKYPLLAGVDYREKASLDQLDSLYTLPAICADLHQRGVYFRAIHLGNILHQASGQYALIDISDCQFTKGPLGMYKRARNLAHLMNYSKDKTIFEHYPPNQFIEEYLSIAALSPLNKYLFKQLRRTKHI